MFPLLFFLKSDFGVAKPGSLFERSSYEEKVYALVFPGEGTKNYYLPVDVTKGADENGNGHYTVNTIYWPNGGTTDLGSDCGVDLNQKTDCTATDENGTEYYVQLTNNVASK